MNEDWRIIMAVHTFIKQYSLYPLKVVIFLQYNRLRYIWHTYVIRHMYIIAKHMLNAKTLYKLHMPVKERLAVSYFTQYGNSSPQMCLKMGKRSKSQKPFGRKGLRATSSNITIISLHRTFRSSVQAISWIGGFTVGYLLSWSRHFWSCVSCLYIRYL